MTCHLSLKTWSSSQSSYLSKITQLSTNCPNQKTQSPLFHFSFILLNTASKTLQDLVPASLCSSVSSIPWHSSPCCDHTFAVPRMNQLTCFLCLSCLWVCLFSIVLLTAIFSIPCPSSSSTLLTYHSVLIFNVTSFENTSLDQIKSSCWHSYSPQT